MGRKVVISNRSVYHKYAEVTIEIPNDIKEDDIPQWLYDNELEYTDALDEKLSKAEYVFGFGIELESGMDELNPNQKQDTMWLMKKLKVDSHLEDIYNGKS